MIRHGLGPGRVAAVFLVVGGLSTIGWMAWERTGRLIPAAPLLAALLLGLLIIFILSVAWPVRSYLRGRSQRHLDPMRATRALVFAQAGALTGAAAAGWYAAQLVLVVMGRDLSAYRDRLWGLVLLTVASSALSVAGLWAQSWCRLEPRGDDRHDDESDGHGR